MPPYEQKDIDRFWSYVIKGNDDDCWWWQGSIKYEHTDDARGWICIKKKQIQAHRCSLAISLGRHIAAGLHALHTCDNTLCVNPKHLYEDTHGKNMLDKKERGRCPKTCPTKLNLEKAREIRKKHKAGVKVPDLSKEFKVTIGTVYHVLQNRTWNTECLIIPENVITHA
jgi:hypothetical protein